MTDKQIACFLEVANCLSFSKAASALFMTQPAVTHQIAALENELGFSLFNRNYRSITLTEAGMRFYKGMKKIDTQINDLILQSRSLMEEHGNHLTISHYSPEGDPQFYRAVQLFTAKHDTYRLDIRLPAIDSLCALLLSRKLDALIVPKGALSATDELCTIPLFSNPEYCIMSRQNKLANLTQITLNDLRGSTLMLHQSMPDVVSPSHELQVRKHAELYDLREFHSMREMITNLRSQSCVLFSLYPLMFISDDLVRIPFADGPQVETVLAYRKDNEKSAMRALISFLPSYYSKNQ